MKPILFFMFIANFFFAQNPDLMNTNWQITKIENELGPNWFPPAMPYQQVTHFSENTPQLSSSFFNTVSANLIYSGENNFTLSNKTCTLADYEDDNGEVNQFFSIICNFFSENKTYNYSITNNGNQKTLVISTPIFEQMYFTAVNLNTSDAEASKFTLAPNPIKSILTVQNPDGISVVKLFDISGKLVYELKNESEKILKINMQNFKSGIYFIKLNDNKTFKIIKE